MSPRIPSPATRRAPLRGLLVVVVAALLAGVTVTPADAQDPATDFVARINAERANAGLPALAVAGDLADVARRHTERMAAENRLYHNPNLGSEVSNWQRLTENVGRGGSVANLHTAFMSSASHRANILDAQVTQVGVGVVVAGDTMWVTQVFRLPQSAPAPAPAPPAPAPSPAAPAPPAPAPPPAPAAPAPAMVSVRIVPADHGAIREAPAPGLTDRMLHVLTLVSGDDEI
jgi:hypothetical protein